MWGDSRDWLQACCPASQDVTVVLSPSPWSLCLPGPCMTRLLSHEWLGQEFALGIEKVSGQWLQRLTLEDVKTEVMSAVSIRRDEL